MLLDAGPKSVAGSEAPFPEDTASVMDGTDDMDADDESAALDPRELKRQRREQEEGDAEFPDEVGRLSVDTGCNKIQSGHRVIAPAVQMHTSDRCCTQAATFPCIHGA